MKCAGERFLLYKGQFGRAILVGFIISVAVTVLAWLGYFKPYQNPLSKLLHFVTYQKADHVDFLFITKKEYQEGFRGVSPLSRRRLAELVNLLVTLRARVIALDIDLSDPSSEDPELAEAMRRASAASIPIVVVGNLKPMAEKTPADGDSNVELRPYPEEALLQTREGFILFQEASPGRQWSDRTMFGGVSFRLDEDGVLRKAEAFYLTPNSNPPNGSLYQPVPSFPVAVAAAYQGLSQKTLMESLADFRNLKLVLPGNRSRGGQDIEIQMLQGGTIIPNFIGNYAHFDREVDLHRLLKEYGSRESAAVTIFRDKIVIVGGTFDEKDFFATPVGRMSGIEILGNIIESILRGNLITPTSFWKAFAIQVFLGVTTAWIFMIFSRFWAILICLLALAPAVAVASLLSFSSSHYWFDFVPTIAGVMIYGWVLKAEEALKKMKRGKSPAA